MFRLLEQQAANIIGNQVSAPVDECVKLFMNAKGCGLCCAGCLSAKLNYLPRVDVQMSLQGSCCDENPSILSDSFCAVYETTAAVLSFIGWLVIGGCYDAISVMNADIQVCKGINQVLMQWKGVKEK
ncbi:hypothetical protein ILYODFUR_037907 [Ilyodon furcidens]|uniref:Uncharacterized protein n=1 Tax=Ilyodon furcidens TaxID=33524 RepID=A0ABV0UCG8_9TELE